MGSFVWLKSSNNEILSNFEVGRGMKTAITCNIITIKVNLTRIGVVQGGVA